MFGIDSDIHISHSHKLITQHGEFIYFDILRNRDSEVDINYEIPSLWDVMTICIVYVFITIDVRWEGYRQIYLGRTTHSSILPYPYLNIQWKMMDFCQWKMDELKWLHRHSFLLHIIMICCGLFYSIHKERE